VTYPVDYTAHTWVDVPEGTTPPPGAPDLEATTLQGMDDAIAGAYKFRSGDVFKAKKDPITGFWPTGYNNDRTPIYTGGAVDQGVRPTDLALVTVIWDGPDPSPPIVSSGTGGMLSDSDWRFVR
jgi:hypothetical protein